MISLVAAMTPDRVVGYNGDIPWKGRLPRDMKRFQGVTVRHDVVMGRKTWESLPEEFRPLPNRGNVILTRNASYEAPGATIITSIDEILSRGDEVMVIGGGEIYELFLEHADRIYLTIVLDSFKGDAFFPEINLMEDWYDTTPARFRPVDGKNELPCIYRDLMRIERSG